MSDLTSLEMELKELRRQMRVLLDETAREEGLLRVEVAIDLATTVLTNSELAMLILRLLQREGITATAMLETA